MKNKLYFLALMAGVFWGTIGTFGRVLMDLGFQPIEVAFCRLFFGSAALIAYALWKRPKALRITVKGLGYTLVIGIFSQALFNLLYFSAIRKIGIAAAAVLLYTAPVFLAFLSRLLFQEQISKLKGISIGLCVLGSFFAVTGGMLDLKVLDGIGVLMGLGAAICYAFLSVVSKQAMKELDELTLSIYSFLIGWMMLIPLAQPWAIVGKLDGLAPVLAVVGQGIITSAVPYMLYMTAVRSGVELTRAGVICSVELILSVVLAAVLFKEPLTLVKAMGIGLIFISILLAGSPGIGKKWGRNFFHKRKYIA